MMSLLGRCCMAHFRKCTSEETSIFIGVDHSFNSDISQFYPKGVNRQKRFPKQHRYDSSATLASTGQQEALYRLQAKSELISNQGDCAQTGCEFLQTVRDYVHLAFKPYSLPNCS